MKIVYYLMFGFILLFLEGCDKTNTLFDNFDDVKKKIEFILSKKCQVKVFTSMNGKMSLNGEVRIDNLGVNFISKTPPQCTDTEVKEEFEKFILKNNFNKSANIVIFPWKKSKY